MLSEHGRWPNDPVSITYANRLRTSLGIASPTGSEWSQTYGYDTNRRLTGITSPARTFDYTYDNEGELTGAFGREATGTVRTQDRFNYTYDAAGNLNTRERPSGAATMRFGVNSLKGITNAAYAAFSGLGAWSGLINVSGSATNVAINGQTAGLCADNSFSLNMSVTTGANTFTANAICLASLGPPIL